MHFLAALLLLFLFAAPASAEPPRLSLPIACTPDEDCWLVNLVDHDPGKGVRDFRCTNQTYDTHKGTDIAIADMAAMANGVDVLAAAPGIVVGVRDGMTDIDVGAIGGPKALKGKDCGNGVMLAHPDNWTTQYCHLRKGSVTVKKGDRVARGGTLGQVGLSGRTQFPHIHLTVRHGDTVIDPFVGPTRTDACGPGERPLWTPDALSHLIYHPARFYIAGFADERPTGEGVRDGAYNDVQVTPTSPVIAVWADAFWLRDGDMISFHLTRPDGTTALKQRTTIRHDQARGMVFVGLKRKGNARWQTGPWRNDVRLVRGGAEIARIERTHTVR